MRTLSNNHGISLIVLIAIIVALGLLGAGIVSFMGTKHRSYPIQAQSYQAFNIANAGVEFAIRYANDNIVTDPGQDPTNDFLHKPYLYIPCYTTSTLVPECSSYIGWRTVTFDNGQFSISYDVDAKTLYSRGVTGMATREVKLTNFIAYLSSGGLSLVPGTLNEPHQISGDNKGIHIPLTNNTDKTLYVFRIDIGMPGASGADAIEGISYKREVQYGGTGQLTPVYDYNLDQTNPYYKKNNGIEIPATPSVAQMTFNISPYYYPFPPTGITTDTLTFKSSARKDWYYVVFHYSENLDFSNPQTSAILFKVTQNL